MKTKEIIFGDKSTFAIRYISDTLYSANQKQLYCSLHLILNGILIGDKDETCYKNTWLNSINNVKNNIVNNKYQFKAFENLTDYEIFEVIENYNKLGRFININHISNFENLEQNIFLLSIDETIDAYNIVLVEIENMIKILWKGWRDPCPIDEIDQLISISVGKEYIVEVIDECIEFVKNDNFNKN